MADSEPRPRGRPRSEETRLAILAAAFDVGASDDQQDFSIAGIAARAGVSKQTVYRWWPSKADVLMEALAHRADLQISTLDRGSYADDLQSFLGETFDVLTQPGVVSASRSLMAEAQQDHAFRARFRERFLDRRRAAFAQIVQRADARGDLPPGIDGELAADIVFGTTWYRMLTTSRPLGDTDAAALATLLSGGRPERKAAR
ncbi:TetR/AcrR family transcriptional regulator [Conexibacter sp. CPCC 206217]|uniref:TetR/AcrR family transcriptional regulator n=1 Tax=Conexibacter sp. CPCC 206217 TaxID=3064574 RepID=UPI00271B3F7A|nr:TetR/AcrR family transcriptional regulator [Conexibacter sp. CPCC 206217]MDO8210453.1 TetR/AcrR family transcriptional regulator [Conexibacter sp. CPCC 206217]